MENVILTVHLILALLLIGVVLLQRSEGGGLGMGSGGGGGAISGRAAATALGKLSPGLLGQLRAGWEALNNGWNQWVLNYTQSKQLDMLNNGKGKK